MSGGEQTSMLVRKKQYGGKCAGGASVCLLGRNPIWIWDGEGVETRADSACVCVCECRCGSEVWSGSACPAQKKASSSDSRLEPWGAPVRLSKVLV